MRELVLLNLTDEEGDRFYLDADAIEAVGDRGAEDGSAYIRTRSGGVFPCQETAEQIFGKYKELLAKVGWLEKNG